LTSGPSVKSRKQYRGAVWGAAFLMATSAIGPGFLTQTTVFTRDLLTSFGFIILLSVIIDICAQLNIWRIITMSEKRAQDLANGLWPGTGYLLAILIAGGGLVFNIGNIGGTGLGLNVLTGLDVKYCALISCLAALGIFWYREAGPLMDRFTKLLGMVMIAVTVYIAFSSHPPVGKALYRTIWPEKIDVFKIITLVGGTVGGYISFAGAHRLLDAGISGKENLPLVTRSAVSGILITSLMRFILFFAVLGVVWQGLSLDIANPPASVFKLAAGEAGYKFFGMVMWSASITSVIGASYTTVSFWKTFHPAIEKHHRLVTSLFIITSTLLFLINPRPVKLLIIAGAVNGMILPLALAVILTAVLKKTLVKDYRHPLWMQAAGWIVVIVMTWMSIKAFIPLFSKI